MKLLKIRIFNILICMPLRLNLKNFLFPLVIRIKIIDVNNFFINFMANFQIFHKRLIDLKFDQSILQKKKPNI
jgi:hypothetical protein